MEPRLRGCCATFSWDRVDRVFLDGDALMACATRSSSAPSRATAASSVRAVRDRRRRALGRVRRALPEATFFHRIGWRDDHRATCSATARHYLLAERGGAIVGVLPLAEVKSLLFGHALVSLPFCVYGGAGGRRRATPRAR